MRCRRGNGLPQFGDKFPPAVAYLCPRSARAGPREHRKRSRLPQAFVLRWRSPQSHEESEDPRKAERPVWSRQVGPQGILQLPVTPFYHDIRVWMKGGCRQVLDTQLLAQSGPYGRGELGTLVRGQLRWNSISGNPPGNEGICACGGGNVPHG
jgi:hypothetical protein